MHVQNLPDFCKLFDITMSYSEGIVTVCRAAFAAATSRRVYLTNHQQSNQDKHVEVDKTQYSEGYGSWFWNIKAVLLAASQNRQHLNRSLTSVGGGKHPNTTQQLKTRSNSGFHTFRALAIQWSKNHSKIPSIKRVMAETVQQPSIIYRGPAAKPGWCLVVSWSPKTW